MQLTNLSAEVKIYSSLKIKFQFKAVLNSQVTSMQTLVSSPGTHSPIWEDRHLLWLQTGLPPDTQGQELVPVCLPLGKELPREPECKADLKQQ